MKIHFLGTGTSQGIPVIGCACAVCTSTHAKDKRLRVSVWVSDINFSIVIDCGPDFRQQMLASHCPNLDALLFTHEHADHTAGLDDIRPFSFSQGKIPLFAEARVLQNLKKRFDYIFEEENKYPGAPSVLVNEIKPTIPFFIQNKKIIPVRAWHGTLPILGFRIDDFAYFTDVKFIEDDEIAKLKGVKVLVINALRHEEHHSHFSLQEALIFINLVQPQKAFLTHISHHLENHQELEKILPKNVFVAFDTLEITI